MKNIFKHKKGSILDLVFIMTALLIFAMVVLIGFKLSSEVNTQVQDNIDIPTEAKTASTQLLGFYPGAIDNTFLFLTVGLAIVTLIMAALVKVHPIFIPLFIIGWIIIIFLAGICSNIYRAMAVNPNLAAQATALTYTSFIMGYLPLIVGGLGILLMIVIHKLGGGAGE